LEDAADSVAHFVGLGVDLQPGLQVILGQDIEKRRERRSTRPAKAQARHPPGGQVEDACQGLEAAIPSKHWTKASPVCRSIMTLMKEPRTVATPEGVSTSTSRRAG
jgi:hypothetical protein